MNIHFSADCHFDHSNIIKFCNRPFKNITHMNEEIVNRWNKRVKPDDLVYHIGDFTFKGVSNCKTFESRLNGTIVHIKGNHDKNNGVKTYITSCLMEWGGLGFYVKHKPPEENQIGTLEARIMSSVDLVICGHIHELWKHKIVPYNVNKRMLCINVGVDVWNFEPVSVQSILKYVGKVRRGLVK